MLKKIILAIVGVGLLGLGIVGLALPFLPGIIFLLLAALCFAALSRKVHDFLSRHPRIARFFHRVEQGHALDLLTRLKLIFWAGLEALGSPRVR